MILKKTSKKPRQMTSRIYQRYTGDWDKDFFNVLNDLAQCYLGHGQDVFQSGIMVSKPHIIH
ncbi:hypothetical protein SAMN05444955_109130 [Lihuaxuella thermophila]|uniref:Uncharacterized protein n=1 Tax=Lihuaxuella thermophila TaxID=1173111 RepID=A0A1H8FY05_9BACL|nr:hypothetical protein SAMN05444955_109130 [Lihuaxuella thermophila]